MFSVHIWNGYLFLCHLYLIWCCLLNGKYKKLPTKWKQTAKKKEKRKRRTKFRCFITIWINKTHIIFAQHDFNVVFSSLSFLFFRLSFCLFGLLQCRGVCNAWHLTSIKMCSFCTIKIWWFVGNELFCLFFVLCSLQGSLFLSWFLLLFGEWDF